MARVRCLMMQRDEDLLLESWFRYYGYLFGFENLTVFDNNSKDKKVIETLRTYERAGADIRWEHGRPEDFLGRNAHFENVIRHWDARGDYDFVLPVDCDEFLAVFTNKGVSCSREAIHLAFDALLGEKRVLEIISSFRNIPSMPGYFKPEDYMRHFLAADTVQTIDQGLKGCTSSRAEGYRITDFTLFHMHNKPFPALLRHTHHKLEKSVPLDNPKILSGYRGPEAHLIQYLQMEEEDYLRPFRNGQFLSFPDIAVLLRALGIAGTYFTSETFPKKPTPGTTDLVDVLNGAIVQTTHFNAQTYLHLNLDVLAANAAPLWHYLKYGQKEKRAISEESPSTERPQPLPEPEMPAETPDTRKILRSQLPVEKSRKPAPRRKKQLPAKN
ncbi:glycosyltransferase family 2 protein [Acetobacter conturbans]|uniref:Glycosyl transferase family 2 n=1 Tax=Acetobacter conturbans TaxID=1737472 RepID=A0ABX0K1L6_9PROT|nr:glycosyltransferase family 2 protein [Acetobacter conturbans]NHN88588.1 hypothetical protein [Acetobacter conturbans]